MKLLLIAPAGLEVQGVKGKHVHHLNLAVLAGLAEPYFDEIRIIEEEFERLDPNETADLSNRIIFVPRLFSAKVFMVSSSY